jgi:DMSO/TMAO reductase YedYZ heme-binding membrane subunit
MPLNRAGIVMLLGIIALSVIIAVLVLPEALPEVAEEEEGLVHVLVRLFGLYGFLFLGVATLITPFLKEVTQAFGKPFLRIHHAFSILGIIFITLHPVFNAIQRLSLSVFVPRFDSWERFWMFAGRPAFIILYIALLAAFLRAKAPKYWRPFHALMYIVLLFGIVHANLIGDDFGNVGIMIIFNALFVASIAVFAIKRFRNYARTRI